MNRAAKILLPVALLLLLAAATRQAWSEHNCSLYAPSWLCFAEFRYWHGNKCERFVITYRHWDTRKLMRPTLYHESIDYGLIFKTP